MGRQRRQRNRAAAKPRTRRPEADAVVDPSPEGNPWADPQWRKAERRRALLLTLLPGPFQAFARRGTLPMLGVVLLQLLLVFAVGLLLVRVISGRWLPPYAGVTVLAIAVATQFVCRSVNLRAEQ